MCDPSILATLSAVSTVVGLGGTAASAIGQMSAAKKQENAVNAWQAKQTKFRNDEAARQEDLRKQADAARVSGLDKLGVDKQTAAREAEEERLKDYMTGGAEGEKSGEAPPVSVADAALTGQTHAGDDFKSDMARKINEATTDARARIARLARVGAYTDSSGGRDRYAGNALFNAGLGIDEANKARESSLGAFGVEKGIRPVEMSYSNPFADAFSTALQVGSAGLGKAYSDGGLDSIGGMFKKRAPAKGLPGPVPNSYFPTV